MLGDLCRTCGGTGRLRTGNFARSEVTDCRTCGGCGHERVVEPGGYRPPQRTPDLTREYHTQVIELLAAERDRLRDAAHFAIGQASAGAERSRDPYARRLCASIADGLGAALTTPTPDTEVAVRKGSA